MENEQLSTLGNKRIAINMIANIVSYSSTILISFVLTPYLINTLGKEAYSFYPLANNIVSYMSILSNALNSMSSRFITIEIIKKDYDNANKYFSSIFFANIIMSGILFILMALMVLFLEYILDIPLNLIASVKLLFCFVFASMLVSITTSVFGIATYAKNRIDLRSGNELVVAILRILLFVFLFKFFLPTIVYVGVVAFIIAIVNFIFQKKFTRILLPEIKISVKNFSIKYVKTMLSSGVWNSVNQLGNILLASSSLLLANVLYGASGSGTYSIIQTVPNFINGVITMLTGVFVPVITYRYAQNNKKSMLNEINKAQKLIGLISCSVIAVFIGLSFEFFTLWTPAEDAAFLQIISTITIIPHFIIGSVWPISNLNAVMNRVKTPAIYMICSGVANVVIICLTYMIAAPGIISIPIISSIIQLIWVGVFIPMYPCEKLGVKKYYFYTPLVRMCIGGIVVVLLTYMIKSYFVINSWLMFFTVGIICGALALAINFVFMYGTTGMKFCSLAFGKLVSPFKNKSHK